MPCYHPQLAYRSRKTSKNGKRPLVFNPKEGYTELNLKIPCGNCLGCKLEKARQWAVRCYHEAMLHYDNCFITLTYNDDNLPLNGSLQKRDLQLFMKRLRKQTNTPNIKFYASGEYGKNFDRPHYHVCLFGYDFKDKFLKNNKLTYKNFGHTVKGYKIFRSPLLEKLWTHGFSSVGTLNEKSAGYTARYVLKKIFGKNKEEHYQGREPEFSLMSRGGTKGRGLSYGWFKKYTTDIYPKDFFTINGKRHKPPRYYDKLLEETNPDLIKKLKIERMKKADEEFKKHGLRRLERKEHHKKLTIKLLKREYEEGE